MFDDAIRREVRNAIVSHHRRILVLVGSDGRGLAEYAARSIRVLAEEKGSVSGVYMFQGEYPDAAMRQNLVSRMLEGLEGVRVEFRHYKDTEALLGTTVDFAVLDLIDDLKPNDVGRLGGIVAGGGLYVMMIPGIEEWTKYLTKFQSNLLTPQFSPNDVRHYLKERFWRKLWEHSGVMIYDVESGKFLKYEETIVSRYTRKEVETPRATSIPLRIYKLALTQDQVEVLTRAEKLAEKPPAGMKRVLVVIADRGRGKSAAIGLALAGIAHRIRRAKAYARVVVIGIEYGHVSTLLDFVIRGLRALGYPVEVREVDGEVKGVKAKGIYVDYITPYQALHRENADVVAVDEAASVPLPVLFAIHKKFDRIIFSSTIHGYEGAGRGFSVRFMRHLRESEDAEVVMYEMKEPIRYAPDDPVERWLFDTFLLDAEPAKITADDLKLVEEGRVKYLAPDDLRRFFLEDENLLRQFFGIYVQAHYRNEPDDLGMMMDAPHHSVRALLLESGKVVVSVELAYEGALNDDVIDLVIKGVKLPGNIIPDRFVKYWRVPEFAKMRGWRIVRIATHPELQDRGLGTAMLKFLEEEARSLGLDWIGTGFGVNPRLLKFWLNNGFVPIHISPERNPVSGEYSVLLVKPLNEACRKVVQYASAEFRRRLLLSLMGPYNDLEPEVAHMLLRDFDVSVEESEPELSQGQLERLVTYAYGPMTYENVCDAMFELAKAYFFRSASKRPKLPQLYELALVAKVLQAKPWKTAAEDLGIPRNALMLMLREVAKVLLGYFYGGRYTVPLFIVSVVRS